MSKWIDADALDRAFSKLRFNNDGELNHYGDRPTWCLWGSEIENLIADAPSIDIEPKRGEWLAPNDDESITVSCRCSNCGWKSHLYEDDVYGMPYCPNCGADMREREGE